MHQLLQAAPSCSASTVLAPDRRRRSHAEAWLEQALTSWRREPALAGRWLAAADTHLRAPGPLTLSAEYDPEAQVFSLGIWHGGRRIYRVLDWLG